jgi:hypothetical protein
MISSSIEAAHASGCHTALHLPEVPVGTTVAAQCKAVHAAVDVSNRLIYQAELHPCTVADPTDTMRKATFMFALVAVLAGAGILHQEQQLNPQQQHSKFFYPIIEHAAGAAVAAAAAAAAPAVAQHGTAAAAAVAVAQRGACNSSSSSSSSSSSRPKQRQIVAFTHTDA